MGKKYNIDITDKFFSVNDLSEEIVDNSIAIQEKSTPKSTPESNPKSTPKSTPESNPKSTPKSTPESNPKSTPESNPKGFKLKEKRNAQITLKIRPSVKKLFEDACEAEDKKINAKINDLIIEYLKKEKLL